METTLWSLISSLGPPSFFFLFCRQRARANLSFCGFNFKVHLNWTHLKSTHKKWACTYSLSNECRLCKTSTHALMHTHKHTHTPNQHLSRMYVNMRRHPHKSAASRWTESRNTRENFNDASRHPSLFLPLLFLRRVRWGVLLTGTVVCIQQMWDETHPRRDALILCVFVNALFFPLPPPSQCCCSWPTTPFPGTWRWLCPTYWPCLR